MSDTATKHDLGLAIVRYAEKKARLAKMPTWGYVSDILCCGSTLGFEFCREHLPKIGWKRIADCPAPEHKAVLTAEGLGDSPRWLIRIGEQWTDKKGNVMHYQPSWWKDEKR